MKLNKIERKQKVQLLQQRAPLIVSKVARVCLEECNLGLYLSRVHQRRSDSVYTSDGY